MIRNFNYLTQFRFWCQKVLPLVYDDSLSYYEVLCKLTNIVNELIENIANTFEEINSKLVEYVNQWLLAHPDVTTTVQDNSLTLRKFNTSLKQNLEPFTMPYVTENGEGIAWEHLIVIPQMFGALADGETDDTQAIIDALDYIHSHKIGTLYFPKGTYNISSTINTEYGGEYSTSFVLDRYATIRATSVMETMFKIGATYAGDRPYTHRRNLEKEMFIGGAIDGNNLAKCGIDFYNFRGYTFRDTIIYNTTEKGILTRYSGFYDDSHYTSEFTANNINMSFSQGNAVTAMYLESPDCKLSNIHVFGAKRVLFTVNAVYVNQLHGTVADERDYPGSIFVEDRSSYMSSYTDCYSDTYETSYKLYTSTNITGCVTYFWMTKEQIETYTTNRPKIFDCEPMLANSNLIVNGYKVIGEGFKQNFIYMYMGANKTNQTIWSILQGADINGFYTRCPIDTYDYINGVNNNISGILSADDATSNVAVGKYLLVGTVVQMSGYKTFYVDGDITECVGANLGDMEYRTCDNIKIYCGADAAVNSTAGNAKINITHLGGSANKYTITTEVTTYQGKEVKIYRIYIHTDMQLRGPILYNYKTNIYNGYMVVESAGKLTDSNVTPIPVIQDSPTGYVIFTET